MTAKAKGKGDAISWRQRKLKGRVGGRELTSFDQSRLEPPSRAGASSPSGDLTSVVFGSSAEEEAEVPLRDERRREQEGEGEGGTRQIRLCLSERREEVVESGDGDSVRSYRTRFVFLGGLESVRTRSTHLAPTPRILSSDPPLLLPVLDALRSLDLVPVDVREVVLRSEVGVV